ncbi:MAG: cytochrome c family protein [Burkholderiales bacterium]|jgi:cytochrome c|nr:cytochrome c family protein [Burkholderiales bacterium]
MTPRALVVAGALCVSGLGVPQPALSAGDWARGEALYGRCQACHAPAFDRVGPRHCGLFGRRAGSVPGFAYSAAMKRSPITWDEKTLDRFLAAPMKVVPGTTMTYDGVPDRQERTDLIAFLRQLDHTRACGER